MVSKIPYDNGKEFFLDLNFGEMARKLYGWEKMA
jgi:hypothetical protein